MAKITNTTDNLENNNVFKEPEDISFEKMIQFYCKSGDQSIFQNFPPLSFL